MKSSIRQTEDLIARATKAGLKVSSYVRTKYILMRAKNELMKEPISRSTLVGILFLFRVMAHIEATKESDNTNNLYKIIDGV